MDQCWEMCQRKVSVPDITKLSCRKTLTGLGNETWTGNMLQVIIDGSLNGRMQETTGNIWKIIDKQWTETADHEPSDGFHQSSFVGFLQSLSRPDQNSSASDTELAGVQPSEAPLSHSLRGIAGWESMGFSITLVYLKMGYPRYPPNGYMNIGNMMRIRGILGKPPPPISDKSKCHGSAMCQVTSLGE